MLKKYYLWTQNLILVGFRTVEVQRPIVGCVHPVGATRNIPRHCHNPYICSSVSVILDHVPGSLRGSWRRPLVLEAAGTCIPELDRDRMERARGTFHPKSWSVRKGLWRLQLSPLRGVSIEPFDCLWPDEDVAMSLLGLQRNRSGNVSSPRSKSVVPKIPRFYRNHRVWNVK